MRPFRDFISADLMLSSTESNLRCFVFGQEPPVYTGRDLTFIFVFHFSAFPLFFLHKYVLDGRL